MPVSHLQIYNAVNAYKKQQRTSGPLQRKESAVSPFTSDEANTSGEESQQAIDDGEKDDN